MAVFTVGEVEDRAREILLDTFEGAYRFEPKEIYRALEEGVRKVRHDRPASRYVNGLMTEWELDLGAYSPGDEEAFRSVEVEMERWWLGAIVNWVVHKMYLKDDPDTTNGQLAAQYLQYYADALG